MAATLPGSELSEDMGRTADIAGAERVLDNLEKRSTLSHAGRLWFEVASDPFHDRAIEIDGYPDGDQTASIVQVVKRSFDVTCPADVILTGGLWDCNIALLPQLVGGLALCPSAQWGQALLQAPSALASLANGMQYHACMSVAVPTGTSTFPNATDPGAFTNVDTTLFPGRFTGVSPVELGIDPTGSAFTDDPYLDGAARLIAAGLEVIDRSSVLNQQGTACPWRQNAIRREEVVLPSAGPISTAAIDAFAGPFAYSGASLEGIPFPQESVMIRAPPSTLADAMLLPDAKQWHAKRGYYGVAAQTGDENPYMGPENKIVQYTGTDPGAGINNVIFGFTMDGRQAISGSGTQGSYRFGTVSGAGGPTTVPGIIVPSPAIRQVPFDTVGVFFTGLNPLSTLTVNVRWVIERAPSLSQKDLIVLARPSPAYDELAFRLYSEARRKMPPGVQLSENFLGGWFKDVIGSVAKTALPAVASVARAHPVVGSLMGAAGAVHESMSAAKKKKKAQAMKR